MVQHRTHKLNQGPVQTLCNTILVRIPRRGEYVLNDAFFQKAHNSARDVLASVIRLEYFEVSTGSKYFELRVVLAFNHNEPRFELRKEFRISLDRLNPSEPRVVVNELYKVF